MSDEYYGPRFISGHGLQREGAPHDARGHLISSRGGVSGKGRAKCKCGELSEVLESGNERKHWHRVHKEEVRKRLQQEAANDKPTKGEPQDTIDALADISYRGRDTGFGLARIFVEMMIERGWTPPAEARTD